MNKKLKSKLISILPKKISLFLLNYFSKVNIPVINKTVISDLFPFKIHDGWETSFELLNLPMLIDPNKTQENVYIAKFLFFDQDGTFIHNEDINVPNYSQRNTIRISEIIKNKSISGYGTFACFHEYYSPYLISNGGFLAERGYVGYSNSDISLVKGYVHGNLDAISLNENGQLNCLGKGFLFKMGEYHLQHRLEGPAIYQLGLVNTTSKEQKLIIKVLSKKNGNQEKKYSIPSKGIIWFSYDVDILDEAKVIISSKINLPRPVVFRLETKSFDVFHG